MAQRPVRLPVVKVPQEPEIVPEQREQPEAAIPQRQGPDLEVLCLFSLSPCVLISHSLPGFLVVFLILSTFILWLCILCSRTFIACVAGGIRGHERMGSLKYRLPKNDTF